MKKNSSIVVGPKIRYFAHSFGVVHVRRSKVLTVFLPTLITMSLLGGGLLGLDSYQSYRSSKQVLRASNLPSVSEKTPKKESPQNKPKSTNAREDKELVKVIDKKLESMPAGTSWSVSVRDLKSERMANINSDRKHDAADLYKMFLLAPLEAKQDAVYWKNKLSSRQAIGVCVETMIKTSDNDCGLAVGKYVGWQAFDSANQGLGFSKTKINPSNKHQTTAREAADLMYRLQTSQLLSDKARRIVFDGLYGQKHRLGIPTGCGPSCLVGNKTAENNSVKHDMAVVTHGSAKYIIVIMSTGTSWAQVGDVAKAIDSALLPDS